MNEPGIGEKAQEVGNSAGVGGAFEYQLFSSTRKGGFFNDVRDDGIPARQLLIGQPPHEDIFFKVFRRSGWECKEVNAG